MHYVIITHVRRSVVFVVKDERKNRFFSFQSSLFNKSVPEASVRDQTAGKADRTEDLGGGR